MKMRIKSIAFLIVSVILFMTSCNSRSVEDADNKEQTDGQAYYIDASFINDIGRARIAVGSDGDIYITDQHRIYIYDSEGNEKKQIENEKRSYYYLLEIEEDRLFALNARGEIEEYSADGAFIKKYDVLSDQHAEKICYIDGKFIVMYRRSLDGEEKYLGVYNLEDEKFNEIEIEHVRDFIEYEGNTLLVFLKQDCCSGHMLIYNIKNGEKSDEIHIPSLPYSFYSYFNSSEDHLYLLSQRNVTITSIKEKKIVETYTSSNIPRQYTAYYTGNMAYFFDREHKRIIRLNMEDIKSTQNITILCNGFVPGSYFSRVAYEFGIENNGVGVEFIEIAANEYTTKLNSMLMSGDDSFDIYALSTMIDIPSYYIKKGVYEDLNKYTVISNKFEEMFEGIEGLCSYEGSLFGVPIGIINSDTVYQVNTEMLERLDLRMPEYDWTWDDFEKYAEDISAGDGSDYMMKQSKLGFWLFNIYAVSNCIKMDLAKENFIYNKTDIVNELQFVNRLFEKNIIILEEERNSKKQDNLLLNFTYIPNNDGSLNEVKIIPVPVFDDKRVYPFTMNYLCMHKASKNKQSAAAFLGKCISREAQSGDLVTQMPILYKDKDAYENSVYKKFINDDWNYEVYSYMLKNSCRNETYTVYVSISDYVQDYFEGRITSDEAAEAIYKKMRQIVEE